MKGTLGPLAALALAFAAGSAGAEQAEWHVDGELAAVHDDNPARAALERDLLEDTAAVAVLALARNQELGLTSAWTLRAFAETETWAELGGLDRRSGGLQGIYRWQPRLGFTEPFYQVSLTAQADDFDSDFRDSERVSAQGFATRRLTDALRVSLGIEASVAESEGIVFDQRQARAFTNVDLALDRFWSVYGTYSFAVGDTVSSARQVLCSGALAPDIFWLMDAAEAIEPDESLDASVCGNWLAYRLPATTHVAVLGVNRGFGHHLSFDLSVQHVRVLGEEDIDYARTQLRAGLLARF